MNRILYVAVDVDDQAYHGHAVASDEETGVDFQSKPSALRTVSFPKFLIHQEGLQDLVFRRGTNARHR